MAVVLLAAAAAGPHTNAAPTRAACTHGHGHGGATYAPLIRKAYAESKWRDPSPVTPLQARRLHHHRECARSPATLRYFQRAFHRQRRQFERHREQLLAQRAERRALTPYDCGSAGRWAIPCYVVACESGYSWPAYNPSGAAGPYQLMPEWERPWPIDSAEDKLAHHRIAAWLWNGGAGDGNWVCA